MIASAVVECTLGSRNRKIPLQSDDGGVGVYFLKW